MTYSLPVNFGWNSPEEQASGTHARTLRAHCAAAAEAAGQCQPFEPAGADAILYVAEHGCKWHGLPERFGNWHTVYTRMNRWSKNGVLDRVFGHLQRERMIRIRVEVLGLDSTSIKVYPDGTGALEKTARSVSASPGEDGTQSFTWLPRVTGQPWPSRSPLATRTTPRKGGSS